MSMGNLYRHDAIAVIMNYMMMCWYCWQRCHVHSCRFHNIFTHIDNAFDISPIAETGSIIHCDLLLPNYSIFSLCDMLHQTLDRFVFQCYLLKIANTGNIEELAVKPTTAYVIEDYSLPIFIKDHNIAIVTKGT